MINFALCFFNNLSVESLIKDPQDEQAKDLNRFKIGLYNNLPIGEYLDINFPNNEYYFVLFIRYQDN